MKYGSFEDDTRALSGPSRSTSTPALHRDRSIGQLGHGVSQPKSATSLHGERSVVRRSQSQTNLSTSATGAAAPGGAIADLLLRRTGQTSSASSVNQISNLPKAKRPQSRGRAAGHTNQHSLLKARGGGSALLAAQR